MYYYIAIFVSGTYVTASVTITQFYLKTIIGSS
jgi:hypothetical protein